LRIVKILLVLSVAGWGLLGAFGNVNDWAGTVGAVTVTASMATIDPGSYSWRATSSPALIFLVSAGIPLTKLLVMALCLLGARKMWTARRADQDAFATAKTLAVAGCGVAMFLLFTGWIVLAETWYELWRSEPFREAALGSAFRYGAMITLIGLFVGARND